MRKDQQFADEINTIRAEQLVLFKEVKKRNDINKLTSLICGFEGENKFKDSRYGKRTLINSNG